MTENHIYILNASALEDPEVYKLWYEKMPPARQEKINRFRFDKDKRLSLGAGMLMNIGLTRAGIKNLSLGYGEHEKPYLRDNKNVYFNISHSEQTVVCAVSQRPVGVDVESIRHFDERLINYVYLPDEIAQIGTQGDTACTRLWTIKESVMKYFGTGITLGPKKLCVDMQRPVRVTCQDYDTSNLNFADYSFGRVIITVCSEYKDFASAPEYIDPKDKALF